MIKREVEEALLRLAGQFPVVAVTGPRQSGKSTLAQMVFPDKKYISLDDNRYKELAKSSPRDFLMAFPDGAIIDEAQKVPEIFDEIKLNVDGGAYTPGKYILTGSSQFRLRENISDSLAGRVGLIKLLPLSIYELKRDKRLSENPYDYVRDGFYPPFYDDEKNYIREDWFSNYIDTYIDLDVKDHINPKNIRAFKSMLKLCATYSGQLVNYDRISRDIGVSAVTIKEWLSILEASYIIHFLQPVGPNLGKNIVKTPKLYFTDPGLMCYLLDIDSVEELLLSNYKGAAVETMAVSELLKSVYNRAARAEIGFYRDENKLEVDVIAKLKTEMAIEIKSNSASESKLSANVRKYKDKRNTKVDGKVYYLGDLTCMINDIEYVSWREWGTIGTQSGSR